MNIVETILLSLFLLVMAILGVGVVGSGYNYLTGAGTFPTNTPQVVPFPANSELVEFYTAACDIQVLTNQNKSLNTAEYLISPTPLGGDPATFAYTTMNRSSSDWSRWSAGSLQTTPYYCYIHIAQNELLGITNYYFNFTRLPNNNLVGYTTWSSGDKSGTYNFRGLTITGSVSITADTTINALEYVKIESGAQLIITTPALSHTLFISTYNFTNLGTIISTGYNGNNAYCSEGYRCCAFGCGYYHNCGNSGAGSGGPAGNLNLTVGLFNNAGTITLRGGTGGNGIRCGCSCDYSYPVYWLDGGTGGLGGKLIFNNAPAINNTGSIDLRSGDGGGRTFYESYYGNPGTGQKTSDMNATFSSFANTGPWFCSGGAGGAGGIGAGGAGAVVNWSIYGNITTNTGVLTALAGIGGSPANGIWNITYCGNGSGTDWTKFTPVAIQTTGPCALPPSVSFTSPNNTTSLLTLSNNLTANLSVGPSNLLYRYQLSLDNGSTWTYITEALTPIPANSNDTVTFDIYLMNASPNAIMKVQAFNNTSKIYGNWVFSQAFHLLNRNATLLTASSPAIITSTPFTLHCNYTSDGTALQDAAARVYIDGIAYDTTYDFTTKLYSYTWPGNNSVVSGNHTYYCWANKGNFNLSTSSPNTFLISGFAVYYAGGNGTRFFCPFPTYIGAYPAYQTAGKGAIRVQNFNVTSNKNYSVILRYPQPPGMIVYGRCDKLSPSSSGWTVLSDTSGYGCWSNINSTNTKAYLWLKGDCIGATPGAYVIPEIVVVEN